jgi:predicted DNA-binding transcriptional regulator YafY
VHFEVDEIIGLALSVAIHEATPHMPFARSAKAALDRARRALSAERQRAMRRLEKRILVAEAASEQTRESLGPVDDALLSVFERCFTEGLAMAFDYAPPGKEASARRAECVALMLRAPAWYVVSWDLDKDAPRVFRMDRISEPSCGGRLVERHAWSEVIEASTGSDPEPKDHWAGRVLG